MKIFNQFYYRISIVEDEKQFADSVFNGNAFSGNTEHLLQPIKVRFANFLYHVAQLEKIILEDIEIFSSKLSFIEEMSEEKARCGVVALYDGVSYQTSLHGIFYSLKSFLDIYSKFIIKQIDATDTNATFSKGNIDGKRLSGGRFINTIKNISSKKYEHKDELAALIQSCSVEWISEAIVYRDQLAHYNDISGFKDLHVALCHTKPFFRKDRIVEPLMPTGVTLRAYSSQLQTKLIEFIKETTALLPQVDQKLLNYDLNRKIDKSNFVARIEHDEERKPPVPPSRNDQCTCLSGKKYKYCCGEIYKG